jgi:acetyltransferase-like isoleucine patch superfamily enzyme
MSTNVLINQNVINYLLKNGCQIPSLHGKSHLFHDYTKFEPPFCCSAILALDNWQEIGAFTGVYGGRVGYAKIGRYCSIAPNVDIGADQHPIDWLTSSMVAYVPNLHQWSSQLGYPIMKLPKFVSNAQVIIGNDVWIGNGAFIKSGVKIGNGAIVAAQAVVVKDVPDYAIVGGNPAKIIKYRFSEPTIKLLLELEWWDYNIYDFSIDTINNFKNISQAIDSINNLIKSRAIKPYKPNHILVSDIQTISSCKEINNNEDSSSNRN